VRNNVTLKKVIHGTLKANLQKLAIDYVGYPLP
jgi:hypothetical protein